MSSPPWVALYPSDYLADTAHLGLTEHGVYWRLLLHYYQHHGPLPGDLDKICRIVLANSPEERRTVEYILTEFFVLAARDDGTQVWRHLRADKEIADSQARRVVNTARAQAAANARWKRNGAMLGASVEHSLSNAEALLASLGDSGSGFPFTPAEATAPRKSSKKMLGASVKHPSSIAPVMPTTTTTTTTERHEEESIKSSWAIPADAVMVQDVAEEQKPASTSNGKHEYPEAFERTWAIYPKRAGNNSKADAFRAWKARTRQGVSPDDLHAGVMRYAGYLAATGKIGSEYVKQAATFFGPGEHYAAPWHPPAAQDSGLDALRMRRVL